MHEIGGYTGKQHYDRRADDSLPPLKSYRISYRYGDHSRCENRQDKSLQENRHRLKPPPAATRGKRSSGLRP